MGVKVGLRARRGGRLDARSLDTSAYQALYKIGPSPEEEFAVISSAVPSGCQTTEPVKVDLSLEGGQLALLKVSKEGVGAKIQ